MFNPEELFVEDESELKEQVIVVEVVDTVAHFVEVVVEVVHSTPKTAVTNVETRATMPETAEETDVADVNGEFFFNEVTI